MKKTVYLIRHSKVLKLNNDNNNESLQIQNEKSPLSIEGEELARDKMTNKELYNLDLIVSSNYVRAISTAKYLTINNDKEIIIDSSFGERKFGINSWEELPKDFELKQWQDENYKMLNGENQKEVRDRCYKGLINLLDNESERIAIVFHATAMLYLLRKWCDISQNKDNNIEIKFKNKIIINRIENCEVFKLEFNNKELINIERVII